MKRYLMATLLLFAASLCAGAQELRKSVTWENLRNHPAPLPVIGELIPKPSDLNEPSLWSVGAETMDRDYADFSKFRQYMRETGVGYARLQSGWAKTEKKKGKYDFAWLDEHVNGLLEEGIHPWICLCYGNPVYSDHGDNLNAKLFTDGPIMDGWLRYVHATVARYKDKVTMWEVWNEPDGRANLDSWPLYANLFVRTAKVIREVAPDARIAAFASCSPDRRYIRQGLEEIKRLGGIDLIDYITFHAYWPVTCEVPPALRKLRADVDAYSPRIGLLQGETGCPGQLEYGHAMNSIEWTEYSQVKWDLQQAMNHFAQGIPYSFFTMVDLNYGWMLQSYGLLRCRLTGEPVYRRPKFYGVQHVTSIFTPDLKPCESVRFEGARRYQIEGFGVQRDGKAIGAVLWLGGGRPDSSLERQLVDLNLTGVDSQQLVYVDLITGYVHELKAVAPVPNQRENDAWALRGLPLWDGPVLIIDKKEIQYKER